MQLSDYATYDSSTNKWVSKDPKNRVRVGEDGSVYVDVNVQEYEAYRDNSITGGPDIRKASYSERTLRFQQGKLYEEERRRLVQTKTGKGGSIIKQAVAPKETIQYDKATGEQIKSVDYVVLKDGDGSKFKVRTRERYYEQLDQETRKKERERKTKILQQQAEEEAKRKQVTRVKTVGFQPQQSKRAEPPTLAAIATPLDGRPSTKPSTKNPVTLVRDSFVTNRNDGYVTRSKTVSFTGGGVQVEKDEQTGETRLIAVPTVVDVVRKGGTVKVESRSGASPVIVGIDAPSKFFRTTVKDGVTTVTPLSDQELSPQVRAERAILEGRDPGVYAVQEAKPPQTRRERSRRRIDQLRQDSAKISVSQPAKSTALRGLSYVEYVKLAGLELGQYAKENPLKSLAFVGTTAALSLLPAGEAGALGRVAAGARTLGNIGFAGLGAYTAVKQIPVIQQSADPSGEAVKVGAQFGMVALGVKAIPLAVRGVRAGISAARGSEVQTTGNAFQDTVLSRTQGRVKGQKVEASTLSLDAGKTSTTRGKVGEIEFTLRQTPKTSELIAKKGSKVVLSETTQPAPRQILQETARTQTQQAFGGKRTTVTRSVAERTRTIPPERPIGAKTTIRTDVRGTRRVDEIVPDDLIQTGYEASVRTKARARDVSPKPKQIGPQVRAELRDTVPATESVSLDSGVQVRYRTVEPKKVTTRTAEFKVVQSKSLGTSKQVAQVLDDLAAGAKRGAVKVREAADPLVPTRLLRSKRGSLGDNRVQQSSVELVEPTTRLTPKGRSGLGLSTPTVDINVLENLAVLGTRRFGAAPLAGFGVTRSVLGPQAGLGIDFYGTAKTGSVESALLQSTKSPLKQQIPTQEQSQSFSQTTGQSTSFGTGTDQANPAAQAIASSEAAFGTVFNFGSPFPDAPFALGGAAFPPLFAGGLFGGRGRGGPRATQQKGYTPTATAALFDIRGKPSELGVKTGLGIRPVPETKKKRRKK